MSELHVTRITSIGAVEDGDNPGATIQLFKRRANMTENPDRVSDTRIDMDRPEVEGLTEEQAETLTKAFDAYDEKIDALETRLDELTPEDPEDILKDAPEAVRKELADLRKQNEETLEQLRKERETRVRRDYTDLAKSLDVEDAADHLMEIGEAVSDAAKDWLVEQLRTFKKVADGSDLFKEFGRGDAGDPVSQIETLAKEKMGQNSDLTIEQARVLVRKERPDLRDAERAS